MFPVFNFMCCSLALGGTLKGTKYVKEKIIDPYSDADRCQRAHHMERHRTGKSGITTGS